MVQATFVVRILGIHRQIDGFKLADRRIYSRHRRSASDYGASVNTWVVPSPKLNVRARRGRF